MKAYALNLSAPIKAWKSVDPSSIYLCDSINPNCKVYQEFLEIWKPRDRIWFIGSVLCDQPSSTCLELTHNTLEPPPGRRAFSCLCNKGSSLANRHIVVLYSNLFRTASPDRRLARIGARQGSSHLTRGPIKDPWILVKILWDFYHLGLLITGHNRNDSDNPFFGKVPFLESNCFCVALSIMWLASFDSPTQVRRFEDSFVFLNGVTTNINTYEHSRDLGPLKGVCGE